MDLTPQRGAFSRVLNRLARNTKIVFSPQRGGFSWALCLHDYFRDSIFRVTGAALENPVRPSERLKRGWILLFDVPTEQWKGGSRRRQAHTASRVDLLHWGPDERFPSFAEETNKAIFRCLPRPWNKAEKIAVVNSFSSMWLEINCALAAEGQRPSQWQAQAEASTKKDKRDL